MYKHQFKKQYGQNFLRHDRFAKELIKALELPEQAVVVEIGPGDGRVTNLLLQAGHKVLAIEVDYSLIVELIRRFGDSPNFQLVHQDVLQVDMPAELEKLGWGSSYYVVGSLPYNIGKQIISKVLQLESTPQQLAFILQEEVAQDYAAKAPKASFLSNWLQLFARASKLLSIPNTQFFPVPKVNGAILQLKPHKDYDQQTKQQLGKLLRVGFSSPRKTLWNNLRSSEWFSNMQINDFLTQFNLPATIRPAELSWDQWLQLYRHVEQANTN